MTRRGLLRAGGLLPAGRAARLPRLPEPQDAGWVAMACPGCGSDVWFLPEQHANICGWCKTRMVR